MSASIIHAVGKGAPWKRPAAGRSRQRETLLLCPQGRGNPDLSTNILLFLESETGYPVVNNKADGEFFAMTVQYTPGQLRSAASITPETYRHWKKALAPLRRDRGHSPCFSSGDLLAVTVVRTLTVALGIRVSILASIAETLFDLCNGVPWPTLERGKLILDLPNAKLELRPELADYPVDGLIVIIPLRPIVAQLRDQLLSIRESDSQRALRFPLTTVSTPAASATLRGRL
jgi:hypothetical protein